MKRNLLFRGTATALVTPFKSDGSLDEAALRAFVKFQLKGKVEALVPVGSTGEGATLTEAEQARVIEIVVDEVNGKVPVIGGASSNSTAKAVALAKQVKACGADAVLSVAPFYNKPTQEGIFRHFAAVAEAVQMPVVIYNVPGRTSSNIEAGTALRLAQEIEHVAGVKEASANFAQIMEILHHCPEGFGVWSGDDNLTLPMIALGADGVISVLSNEVPAKFSELVRLALKGKLDDARELHYELLHLMNINFVESNPIPVKAAMAMMGMMEEHLRLPLVPLSDASRPKVERCLKELGLIK
ncbi:MAG: 4-hydroxy-tetrahydrodipicolinate synthase [Bacteroidetes bacterium]|nr:4-hydroxy-tetrahydrodipicolinate synthase [Bacteroidota bacterium]MCW5897621.1 4-hydroxy-tetrahydrodipicolinate synthase [Bacteroidota bacterium]